MLTGIEVIRETSNLTKNVWRFWFNDSKGVLVLDEYLFLERATKRHGWKVTDNYRRIDSRSATIGIDDVPWTTDIAEAAMQELFSRIRVVKQ